jgi:hypothetical protein
MRQLTGPSICAKTPELRLREISDIEAANAFAPEFIADYNRWFARAPRSEHDVHDPLQPSDNLARERPGFVVPTSLDITLG